MISPISLTATVLVSMALVAAAQEVKIGSTMIKLTPPRDQCALGNKGDEARVVGKIRELFAERNLLLAAYADCQQLAKFRSGKLETFDDFAHYVTPTGILKKVLPAGMLGKVCASMRTKGDEHLAAILQNRGPDIERAFQGTKMNEIKFVGVLSEEPSICYSGQLQKLTTERGADKMQAAVLATILLKGKLINYQLYARYRDNNTISDMLSKHKGNVAALIAANGR